MIENLKSLCRFPFLDYAIFRPSKTKLIKWIILAQTYLLSMSGNMLIMSLNFYQKNLFQIYLNCIINLSMDVLIIILSRIYVSKKAD